jgi:hypothetical protein
VLGIAALPGGIIEGVGKLHGILRPFGNKYHNVKYKRGCLL